MNELEDILKHHGVKGMKWGVRKSIQKAGRAVGRKLNANRAKSNAKLESFHQKNKDSKRYQSRYNLYKKGARGRSEAQKHKYAVQSVRIERFGNKMSGAIFVGSTAMAAYAQHGKPLVRAAVKKVTSPEAVRAGKNIINAIKRSPVRVVDGKTMKNVIDVGTALVRR